VAARSDDTARRWDEAYDARGAQGVSWYQGAARVSLDLIEQLRIPSDAALIDVGGGMSFLVDGLLERGFVDVTVLDISRSALEEVRRRLPAEAPVELLHADLLGWVPKRRYALWHDRAVFHFLVDEEDRARYLAALQASLAAGGLAILGTFATDGPETCSGLPVARYSAADLGTLLGSAYEIVATRGEVHVTPGGALQPFSWLAARLVSGS
jgi:hypothetical protein